MPNRDNPFDSGDPIRSIIEMLKNDNEGPPVEYREDEMNEYIYVDLGQGSDQEPFVERTEDGVRVISEPEVEKSGSLGADQMPVDTRIPLPNQTMESIEDRQVSVSNGILTITIPK